MVVFVTEPRRQVLRAGFVLLEEAELFVELCNQTAAEKYLSLGLAC